MTFTADSHIDAPRIEQAMRLRYSPHPELTMKLVSQSLNQFRTGELRGAARLWEIMLERDGELMAAAMKRFKAIGTLEWEIVQTEDSPEAEAHAEALRYFYDNLRATSVLEQDQIGGLSLLLQQMMTSHAHRYAIHEIVLRVDDAGKKQVTAEFRQCPVWFFEAHKGRLAFLRSEGDYDGVPMVEGQWLVTVGDGLMRPCSVAYGVKVFPMRDWALYCARFGLPGIHGKTDAAKGSAEWNDFAEAIEKFANDWVTLTNRSAEIGLVEAKGGGASLPFADLIDRSDRLYPRLFRGGDLSTQSRAGDVAGTQSQAGETEMIDLADGKLGSETLNAKVDRPVIRYLFNAEPLAYFKLQPKKQADPQQVRDNADWMVNHGIPVEQGTVLEMLSWPAADETKPLIEKAVPAPNPFGAPPGAMPFPGRATAPAEPSGDRLNAPSALPDPAKELDPAVANESAEAQLIASAKTQLVQAIQTDLSPVAEQLDRILAVTDPGIRREQLVRFRTELPTLLRDINAHPEQARVLYETLSSAFVNGITAK